MNSENLEEIKRIIGTLYIANCNNTSFPNISEFLLSLDEESFMKIFNNSDISFRAIPLGYLAGETNFDGCILVKIEDNIVVLPKLYINSDKTEFSISTNYSRLLKNFEIRGNIYGI